jgi:hypothetical protein
MSCLLSKIDDFIIAKKIPVSRKFFHDGHVTGTCEHHKPSVAPASAKGLEGFGSVFVK